MMNLVQNYQRWYKLESAIYVCWWIGRYFLFNKDTGLATSGVIYRTTNGGFNWTASQSNLSGFKLSFIDNFTGWAGGNFFNIMKSTDGGIIWGRQTSPQFNNLVLLL